MQAIRVANVPDAEFERQVESDDPPTIDELAKQGTKTATQIEIEKMVGDRDPDDFAAATENQTGKIPF